MADLSSLLNPAPSSETNAQETNATEASVHHRGAKAPTLPPVKIGAPNVQPSMKSPLDTLADAATSSVPLLSPTNPSSTPFVSLGAYSRSTVQPSSSSGPSSSHFSPPRSFDHSHAPAPPSPTFSPGLQQYHHPTSSEVQARRASETAETSVRPLPPLREPLPDNNLASSDGALQNLHQVDTVTQILPGIDASAASIQGQSIEVLPENIRTPAVSEIKYPSFATPATTQESSNPPTQSEQAQVKTEATDSTPKLTPPSNEPSAHIIPQSSSEPKQEVESSKSAADMAPKSSPVPAESSAQKPSLKPQPNPSRKRPASKKGTATTVKPAAKKRKVEKANNSTPNPPLPVRSSTPTPSRASKTPAPKGRKQESVTPQRSSSIANDDDEDDEDGVFCICRGPDDHTWMIACDGPCEDWFHGRCINMTEKESPNCTEAGKGETLWKRMCRLEGCRRPARINGNKRSKYCSDEHGIEFMKRLALQRDEEDRKAGGGGILPPGTAIKKGRKTNNSFANIDLSNGNDEQVPMPSSSQQLAAEEEGDAGAKKNQSQLRGGNLESGELKALVTGVKDVSEFRELGDGAPLLPPFPTDTTKSNDIKMENIPSPVPTNKTHPVPYTPTETEHLQSLSQKKDDLRARKKLLDDRDSFLVIVRERAKGVLDELKKKENVKDICGFDARLVWLDEEFDVWRSSPEGIKALQERKLGAPTPLVVPKELKPQQEEKQIVNGDEQRPPTSNGDAPPAQTNNEHDTSEELGKGMCRKKKCERHRYWYKIQQQEIAFAKDEVRQGMRKLDEEEKEVRDRARIRWLEGRDE
ncbi:MAG: hypothetical protein LQ343_000632 [Gyalolechia ehrenbergii]|nr:MAG: hypothetical protein LQ343_000632 [Gyalolechia ehrenbergii]